MKRESKPNYNPPYIGDFISVSELARRLGISESYIRKMVSVTHFINEDEYLNLNGLYFKPEVEEKIAEKITKA